ncbi:MAG: hypoxanthine phosphoribosyltransferase [Alphaproteobacteria bacterium]|nr:hypoxanthine phosphoribosyltransferase [Myxococcales bacterium]MCB9697002.1 hypoxanthine phosphoribosyltransferase [Alphaproteobacteria bacterium]
MDREPEVLIDAERIAARMKELGEQVRAWYPPGATITVVGVLKGSFLFMADLIRTIDGPVVCEFLGVSSYVGTKSSGAVQITQDLRADIAGKHVLIVEDIVDTGLTLDYLLRTMGARHPASLRVVALLDKPSRRKVEVSVDLVGFEIPDLFVVGYGLDLDQLYRNLPYIGVFR